MTDTSKDAAINLIEKYVPNWTIKQLKDGQMGTMHPQGMAAQIGGYLDGKYISTDYILVTRDTNGQEVNRIYKLKDIYNQIKAGQLCLI